MAPYYSILTTKKLRAHEILSVDAHNNRLRPTPNADPSVPNGVEVLRCDGINPMHAVLQRIQSAGVGECSGKRYVAFEVVLTLSPGSDRQPTEAVFCQRSEEFADATYGRANVVCLWKHGDEKSPHVHGLIVPICDSIKPGRPRKGTKKEKRPVVSWNQFSGSWRRASRMPTDNFVMAEWQSGWARVWKDHGYRRGIPSRRDPLLMPWIRGQTAAIQALTGMARDAFDADLQVLFKVLKEVAQLGSVEAQEAVIRTQIDCLRQHFVDDSAALQELAARGIQLEVERSERARLADELAALRSGAVRPSVPSGAYSVAASGPADGELADAPNAMSESTLATQQSLLVHQHLESLGDEEFEAMVALARQNRLSMQTGESTEHTASLMPAFPIPKLLQGPEIAAESGIGSPSL